MQSTFFQPGEYDGILFANMFGKMESEKAASILGKFEPDDAAHVV